MRKGLRRIRCDLKKRWIGEESRIAAIINDIRIGEDWTKNLLESSEKGWRDLAFVSSCESKFKIPGEVAPRDLRGLVFEDIDLSGTDGLANSCMDFCVFKGVLLDNASLVGASLRFSKAADDCVFSRADMQLVDFRNSSFSGVSFEGAIFTGADVRGANFIDAILLGVTVKDFKYSEESWWGFLVPAGLKKWTRFGGAYQSPATFESSTSSLVTKFIVGENLRWTFSKNHSILGACWYLLANYGRSSGRLLFWAFMIWIFFGIIYAGYPLPSFLEGTPVGEILCNFSPKIDWKGPAPSENFIRPFYFSAVTMTTLGFGDITPHPKCWKAHIYVCIQAFLGYLVLGMFLGILIQNSNNHTPSNWRSDFSSKEKAGNRN